MNDSYRILKSPYERSKLILRLDGYDLGDEGTSYTDPSLLMEVLEVRESIENVRDSEASLEVIGAENQEKIEIAVDRVHEAFERGAHDEAFQWTIRLKYLGTIRNEIYGLVD